MDTMDFDNLKSSAEMAELATTSVKETTAVTTEPEVLPEVIKEDGETATEVTPDGNEGVTGEGETEPKAEDDKPEVKPWGTPNHTPKGVLEKFSKLSSKLRQSESQIKQLTETVERLTKVNGGNADKLPTKQDFINAGKTEEDFIDYMISVRTQEQLYAYEQQHQREQELSTRWETSMQAAKADLPDYEDVVADVDLPLPIATMQYLANSEVGPYIAYTIAKRDEIRQNIANMPLANRHQAVLQVEQMVKEWLKAPKAPIQQPVTAPVQQQTPKVVSKPRAPQSLKGGVAKKLDPATASLEEWLGM